MNSITEKSLLENGVLTATKEVNRNKLNLLSGATIPQFCEAFWETSMRDKLVVTHFRSMMQTMYQVGQHKEMLEVLCVLYGIVGLEHPDTFDLLSGHPEALAHFLLEVLLDFEDVFDELISLSEAGLE